MFEESEDTVAFRMPGFFANPKARLRPHKSQQQPKAAPAFPIMSSTATATATATNAGAAVLAYPGGTRFSFQADVIVVAPPLGTRYALFCLQVQPERDLNAAVRVVRFGRDGQITTPSVGKMEELGFRECEFQRLYGSAYFVFEGDAVGRRRRRQLGRNPFFPTLVGDVYLMAEIENPDYDEDDSDADDDATDHFRCHLGVVPSCR